MIKKIVALLLIFIFTCGCTFHKKSKEVVNNTEVLPLMSTQSNAENRVWVGTFQLVWNDLMDYIIKAPIKFVGGTPDVVNELNKQDFKAEYLSESSYYKTYGKASPDLKKQIIQGIKEKFNETSDIVNSIDWSPAKGKYVVYAMLKKDFKFLEPFDKLNPEKFGKNEEKVDYFGIDRNSDYKLHKNVSVLFYNSPDDFAVKLHTQGDDVVYLYRTDDDKPFNQFYDDIIAKSESYSGSKYFNDVDRLKIPDIKLYNEKHFKELCDRQIDGTDLAIADAIETIDFKMNNEGVKLKSEAVIITKLTSIGPGHRVEPRYFYFTDNFVLFLQEKDKSKPYFALKAADISEINKTGKK